IFHESDWQTVFHACVARGMLALLINPRLMSNFFSGILPGPLLRGSMSKTQYRSKRIPLQILGTLAYLLTISLTGCQPAANNANANVNANTNANSNVALSNANMSSTNAGVIVNTREPDKYNSTLVFSIQTEGGEKAIGIPTLSIGVARNGDDRRV